MPIHINKTGSISVVGPKAMNLYRMMMILQGLKMEARFPGMRMTAKAPKCSTIVRKEYGLKGNHAKLIEQFQKLVDAESATVTRVVEGEEDIRVCPSCGVRAVVPAPEGVDTSDGTTHVCNPYKGGCDQGFALQK